MIGTTIDVFLKWRARFRAIADLPVPQTPLMKISLFPFSIESKISFTTSAWVLLFENFRGSKESLVACSSWLVAGTGDWNFESSVIGFSFLLNSDHIISTSLVGWVDCF